MSITDTLPETRPPPERPCSIMVRRARCRRRREGRRQCPSSSGAIRCHVAARNAPRSQIDEHACSIRRAASSRRLPNLGAIRSTSSRGYLLDRSGRAPSANPPRRLRWDAARMDILVMLSISPSLPGIPAESDRSTGRKATCVLRAQTIARAGRSMPARSSPCSSLRAPSPSRMSLNLYFDQAPSPLGRLYGMTMDCAATRISVARPSDTAR